MEWFTYERGSAKIYSSFHFINRKHPLVSTASIPLEDFIFSHSKKWKFHSFLSFQTSIPNHQIRANIFCTHPSPPHRFRCGPICQKKHVWASFWTATKVREIWSTMHDICMNSIHVLRKSGENRIIIRACRA